MADDDIDDIGAGDAPESGGTKPKKKGGLSALLPTILKFAAIGLGAVIFIVTVSAITVRVMRTDGTPQTVTDPTSPFVGVQPILQWFTEIGTITTQTRDGTHAVTVVMNLGFDLGDTQTSSELFSRQHELRDFARRYFASRVAADLTPENETRLRREIMDTLNTRYLNNARIRNITFQRLDVLETQ